MLLITNSTNKDPKWLQILTILLSNPILPFIAYIEDDTEDEAFEIFKKYATTNPNIFYDFARYVNKRLATGELVEGSNDQEDCKTNDRRRFILV